MLSEAAQVPESKVFAKNSTNRMMFKYSAIFLKLG